MGDAPYPPGMRRCGTVLLAAGAALFTAGALVLLLGDVRLDVLGLRISAARPSRLFMEGALACLLGLSLRGRCPRDVLAGLFAAFLISIATESTPRIVGDGPEYVLSAWQLQQGRLPSFGPEDADRFATVLAIPRPRAELVLQRHSVGNSSGRREFYHFWLYALTVAPVAALIRTAGLSINHAFTAVNVVLLCGFFYALLGRHDPLLCLTIAAGPLLWWSDKAHPEVAFVVVLGLAFLWLDTRPLRSALLVSLLAAQNPAFAAVLVAVLLVCAARVDDRRRLWWCGVGALAIAGSPFLYYAWRLGRPAPVSDALVVTIPGLTGLLTPLVDPTLGILWSFPGLALACLIARLHGRRAASDTFTGVLLAVSCCVLLAVFALAGNANHGGTPGVSRYGIWLVPFALLPLDRLRPSDARSWLMGVVCLLSVTYSAWGFHPARHENAVTLGRFDALLYDRFPWLFNPLPEVFAERTGGADGVVALPAANRSCSKVLLIGDGNRVTGWPIPCRPVVPPAWCTRAGARCYANEWRGSRWFLSAPWQQNLPVVRRIPDVWQGVADMAWLPVAVNWDMLVEIEPVSSESPIAAATGIGHLRVLRGPGEMLAFVAPLPDSAGRLTVRPFAPTTVWLLDPVARSVLFTFESSQPVDLPTPRARASALLLQAR
jgi:hypothetical protein